MRFNILNIFEGESIYFKQLLSLVVDKNDVHSEHEQGCHGNCYHSVQIIKSTEYYWDSTNDCMPSP